MRTRKKAVAEPPKSLPTDGFSRWNQIQHFIPVSRETWRKWVKEGRVPQPQILSEHCKVYSNAEIHRWLQDPAGYRPPTKETANYPRMSRKVGGPPFDGTDQLDGNLDRISYINHLFPVD